MADATKENAVTTQQHHPQITPQAPSAGPTQLAPVDPAKAATPRRPTAPAWYARPQVLAALALFVALLVLVLGGTIGWVWAFVVTGALVVVLFMGALAWRRKGKGGLLDRLLSAVGRRGRSRSGTRSRVGGKGGGRWPGIGGRGRAGTGAGGASGGRGSGLRSRLPRMLGGTRGRQTSATAGGARGRTPGGSSPGGNSRKGAAGVSARGASTGRKFGWSGRKNRGDGTGSSGGSPAARPGRKKRPEGSLPGGRANPLNWKGWTPGSTGKGTPKTSTGGAEPTKTTGSGGGRAGSSKPSPGSSGRRAAAAEPPSSGDPEQRAAQQQDRPRHSAGPNTGGNDTMTEPGGMQYSADQSLQRAGANLGTAEAAAAEVQRLYAQAEAAKAKFNEVFRRATQQMESELPSSARLRAEMEATQAQAARAATADEWRAVSANAATLPGHYKREHEVDEERLSGGRGGRHKEKRADVSYAEQDN